MIFLVLYDTRNGRLLQLQQYDDSERNQANDALRAAQDAFIRDLSNIEITLFEGDSLATFKRTHSRYFKSFSELGERLSETARKSA